jgi:hypothetical protein
MAHFRPDKGPPPAPAHLSGPAKKLWAEIARDRPAGYFRPGSYETLATFCMISAELVKLWRKLQAKGAGQDEYDRTVYQICKLAALQCRLCGDLRLDPRRGIDRRSAMRDEEGNWSDDHPLLAGKAGLKLDS